MSFRRVRHEALNEEYYYMKHATGYDIYVIPKPEHTKTYATFAAKYGSIDNTFKADGDAQFSTVPAGIAHFLEHKLFENEKENAFARYAKTGANANAYTSFDKTAYLFSCTDRFAESFEILLDFVQRPYFMPETVKKEQGIIGQEIRMYEDNAEWRVFFNLLSALYHRHPVRIDIAGTIESISGITADMLYRCYNHFYNPSNMVIIVCGPVLPGEVAAIADRCLKPKPNMSIVRSYPDEPAQSAQKLTRQSLSVASPIFHLGIKDTALPKDGFALVKKRAVTEALLQYVAGESSPLYRRLYDEGLINASFATEAMYSVSYGVTMLGGESRNPEKVRELFWEEIARIRREGLEEKTFSRCKNALYGKQVARFDSVEAIANGFLSARFAGVDLFDVVRAYGEISLEDAARRLIEHFNEDCSALSVIDPVK